MKSELDRRSFLMLPFLAPLGALNAGDRSEEHLFHRDYVLGTSMDLAVWTNSVTASEETARHAYNLILDEIDRLSAILSTRNPESEIRRFERGEISTPSHELEEILHLYTLWQDRTGGILSIRPLGADTPLNVDALGKAYIIDRATAAVRRSRLDIDGLLLNIGGDISIWGHSCKIGIANPADRHDNSEPLTSFTLRDGAVTTSGSSGRGTHLIDGRTGEFSKSASSATVVARDAATANALSTTLCIAQPRIGMDLVERTVGAKALRIGRSAGIQRTAGFSGKELFLRVSQTATSNWPTGYQVSIAVTLKPIPRGEDAPYLAAWVETTAGKLVRAIVLWGSKAKYHPELTSFWNITGGSESLLYKVTRVTRLPGSYTIAWNGLDNDGKPVALGDYRIVIETNRYHGTYAKQSGVIACKMDPANTTLSGTTNFEPILIQYGPK